jgi:hypothetical protein
MASQIQKARIGRAGHILWFRRFTDRIGAPIIFCRRPSLPEHESESMLRTYLVCRQKQIIRGRSAQCINNSDLITSTSELLRRQNCVTAHARQLASDHCATEITGQGLPRALYSTWLMAFRDVKGQVCQFLMPQDLRKRISQAKDSIDESQLCRTWKGLPNMCSRFANK